MDPASRWGMAQIVHNDLGRTKQFVAVAIAMLDDFKDDITALAAVMPH
jgi:hypothetical protein